MLVYKTAEIGKLCRGSLDGGADGEFHLALDMIIIRSLVLHVRSDA